jgi:hypothetical protein
MIASAAMILSSCAGSRLPVPPIGGEKKFAVVGFNMDRHIGDRDEAAGGGAGGVLGAATAATQEVAGHQSTVDSLWARFEAGLPGILGATMVPASEVVANAKYKEVVADNSEHSGLVNLANKASYMQPSVGFGFITSKDTAKLRAISTALGVKPLVLVENIVDYHLSTGFAGVGRAKIGLASNLYLYTPEKGIYWSGRYTGESVDGCAMAAHVVAPSNFPQLAPQAVAPVLAKVAEDVQKGKGATPVP